MTVGEKVRFWVPAKLAYANDRTRPQGMLVFDIDLVAIN
jgi:FKBP-type peptidyl-prolyl cis-trans isomerase